MAAHEAKTSMPSTRSNAPPVSPMPS